MSSGRLVVPGAPLADALIGPSGVLILVADVACIRRLEGYGGGRRGRQHGVVAPAHAGKVRHGHVACNAFVSRAVGLVVRVLSGVVDPVFMAGHAGLVGLVLRLELVAAAGRVAVQTVELPRFHAGAHEPGGVSVVFSQVAAVGVIVRVFEGHQTEMVEEPVSRVGRYP